MDPQLSPKRNAADCAIQRCSQMPGAIPPVINKRIEAPTNGRGLHRQTIEMGNPFVVGRDGTPVVIASPSPGPSPRLAEQRHEERGQARRLRPMLDRATGQ